MEASRCMSFPLHRASSKNFSIFPKKTLTKKIIEVRLAVGELSHIEEEQLRFCYEAITTETALEGSKLEIEKIDAMVKCPHCLYRGRPKYWDGALSGIPVATLECPSCGKTTEATDGQECAIKSLRFTETSPIAS